MGSAVAIEASKLEEVDDYAAVKASGLAFGEAHNALQQRRNDFSVKAKSATNAIGPYDAHDGHEAHEDHEVYRVYRVVWMCMEHVYTLYNNRHNYIYTQ
jgi:hypothetical protein